ncbi:MAG: hypothetical protein FIA82_00370, partial [Melioribacter sp.]|nr:hypothetical protein [Melioribacter sp.]
MILPEDASHFADLETSNFEFAQYEIAAWPFRNIQTLFRSFKNWLISKESLEVAEEIFPEYMMNDLDNPPPIYEKTNDANYFSQNQDGDKMKLDLTKLDPAVKAAFEALELQFNCSK